MRFVAAQRGSAGRVVDTRSGVGVRHAHLGFEPRHGCAGRHRGQSDRLPGAVLARRFSDDFLVRYGRWLGFTHENLERSQDFFRRHDQWGVVIGRLVPGLRAFIAIPAGIQGMGWGRFFALNLAGTAFWADSAVS